jgi:hypothetical protein
MSNGPNLFAISFFQKIEELEKKKLIGERHEMEDGAHHVAMMLAHMVGPMSRLVGPINKNLVSMDSA